MHMLDTTVVILELIHTFTPEFFACIEEKTYIRIDLFFPAFGL